MAGNTEKKMLSADLPAELVSGFRTQTSQRSFRKKRALSGAVKLWVSLPVDLQVHVISGGCGENVLKGLLETYLSHGKPER